LAIRTRLATQDPSNAEWQRDLVVSLWKISASVDVTTQAGKHEAQDMLTRALHILHNLDKEGKLAPSHQAWIGIIEKRLEALTTAPKGQ